MKDKFNSNFADILAKLKFTSVDLFVSLALGVCSAIIYFSSMANYVYPGESAHLISLWSGLDIATFVTYPLTKLFAGFFGYSNAIAPVCGSISVAIFYLLIVSVLKMRIKAENLIENATFATRVGGIVASVVFMLTPAVREASTHLEPRMFDLMWLLLSLFLAIPFLSMPKSMAWTFPVIMGIMVGMGLMDSPIFIIALPLYIAAIWTVVRIRGGRGYEAAAFFLLVLIVTFLCVAPSAFENFTSGLRFLKGSLQNYVTPRNWMLVFIFATIPFVISIFSSRKAFGERSEWTQWLFHIAMTFVSILAIATPLAPSVLMKESGVLPVATCAMAAAVVAYVVIYWILQLKISLHGRIDDSAKTSIKIGHIISFVSGGIYSITLIITLLLNFFQFDSRSGEFADRLAEKILEDLGDRTWFVTDGTLDDHLRLAVAKSGRELNLVCLQRDLDTTYIAELTEIVRDKKLGGERTEDLVLSLSLGVLTFVQDWLSSDPDCGKKVAIFGSPDLWYGARIKAIPETLFFGADPDRTSDWTRWPEYNALLHAKKDWGSYHLWKVQDPIEKKRLDLRRHLGLVANNRGVFLQDEKKDDEAFALFELVLNEIDVDNVCSLFNEFELARSGNKKALAKKNQIETQLKAIVADENRRYRLWALANYYGYIRSPEIFMKLGFTWARSGRPGEALQQIRRAIDLIPTDKRTNFLNMMAALYASENNQNKSREMYESVLAKDANNHDALLGLMRLELLDGNTEKAIEYLEKATAKAGKDSRAKVEIALLQMMRGELDNAIKLLREVTDHDTNNLQAWSLLGAVTIQKYDSSKDAKEKASLMKYLEDVVLTAMEKQSRSSSDYYLQTTRAFVLLRKEDDRRREARDAFMAAARDRPDIAATSDLILGLDISLNDVTHAEKQAREVLRRNRHAPLANYVMGSIALQNGRITEAETFLRRAADAPKPVILAMNDLAEVLRRNKKYKEAEKYARKAVSIDPNLYVAWETLGSILLDAKGDLEEAEKCVNKACELSKDKDGKETDVRMLITLARVQLKRNDKARAKLTLRKVNNRSNELSTFELREFEELKKGAN